MNRINSGKEIKVHSVRKQGQRGEGHQVYVVFLGKYTFYI